MLKNFLSEKIEKDLEAARVQMVQTRFPPEPNGYLHIGHVKAIHINFTLAKQYHGHCNLRYDDTNPLAESEEYVLAIQDNIRWLGYQWKGEPLFASDYFDKLYEFAVELIKKGLAFVDFSTLDDIRSMRGSLTEPGVDSPYRKATVEENLAHFEKMKRGEYPDGHCVLRAKIDMQSPNMNLRDPLIYRIRHAHHHRTGEKWCIYPLYDFQHPLSDMIEGVTHSLCSLEFEDHRPLYNWFLEKLETSCRPQQIEFARLNIDYTVLSKRSLLKLVQEGHVAGWDDPRMPTISGMRRRGFSPRALKTFCERVGVTKKNTVIALGTLEHCVREDLDQTAPRFMAVLEPLKLRIQNFSEISPSGEPIWIEAPLHPKEASFGVRRVPLTKSVYIDQDDFSETPPEGFHRLVPGGKVRLRYGYVLEAVEIVKDQTTGRIQEIVCVADPDTFAGKSSERSGKVKGIIHWVSAEINKPAEFRVYDRLFSVEEPSQDKEKDFLDHLNPDSLKVFRGGFVEVSASGKGPEDTVQFERLGFFCADQKDHHENHQVWNRTVSLKDTWGTKASKV